MITSADLEAPNRVAARAQTAEQTYISRSGVAQFTTAPLAMATSSANGSSSPAPTTSTVGQSTFDRLSQLSPNQLANELANLLKGTIEITVPDEMIEGYIAKALNERVAGRVKDTATEKVTVRHFDVNFVSGGMQVTFDYTFETRGWTRGLFGKRYYTPWVSDSGEASAKISLNLQHGVVSAVARSGNVDWRSNNSIVRALNGAFDDSVRNGVANAINDALADEFGNQRETLGGKYVLVQQPAARAQPPSAGDVPYGTIILN